MCFLSPLFIEGLLQKPSRSSDLLWLVHYRDDTRHGFVVVHVVSKFLTIFMRVEKQAYKQLQRYKAKLFEPASINGVYNPMA